MEEQLPVLTEPGVKFFIKETLKKCRTVKDGYYSIIFNVGLLILFVSLLGTLLLYRSKNKPTKEEVDKRRQSNREYVLGKIKSLRETKQRENNTLITSLPKFESQYEKMHKNFYKV